MHDNLMKTRRGLDGEVLTLLSNLVSQMEAEASADEADYQAYMTWYCCIGKVAAQIVIAATVVYLSNHCETFFSMFATNSLAFFP